MKTDEQIALELAKLIAENGGRAYFVGGYVRDKLISQAFELNMPPQERPDIDIEVHKIPEEKLQAILNTFGVVLSYGKSFGIYSLEGRKIEIALPRQERKIGILHTDFEVEIDENLGTFKAAKRRDFTINSIMQDILSGEYIDHYGGISDLNNRIIKYVDRESFIEDPLRVLRACQFASRFNFTIDDKTIELCKSIDISHLSKERIFSEVNKALLKSENPSIFFNNLEQMGHLGYWFKEIKNLIGLEQNPTYHKEGDVFTHTMMVLDQASRIKYLASNPLFFMYAALCHDLGKYDSSEIVNGVIRSIGHEISGIDISRNFLNRFTNNKKLIAYVANMVENHMKPNIYATDKSAIKKTNKMFYESSCPEDLLLLAQADRKGRISSIVEEDPSEFLQERLKIYNNYMEKPFVKGEDLIEAGVLPVKGFSNLLDLALKHRLAGVEKKDSLKQVLALARQEGIIDEID